MAQESRDDGGAEDEQDRSGNPSRYVTKVVGAQTRDGADAISEENVSPSTATAQADAKGGGLRSSDDRALMKRTLLTQSRKLKQLTAKIESMETEREAMGQQVQETRGDTKKYPRCRSLWSGGTGDILARV